MHEDKSHAAVRSALEALIKKGPLQRQSKAALLLEPHRDLITQAISNGHTFGSIQSSLADAGIKVSPESVRRYLKSIASAKIVKPKPRSAGA